MSAGSYVLFLRRLLFQVPLDHGLKLLEGLKDGKVPFRKEIEREHDPPWLLITKGFVEPAASLLGQNM